MAQDRNDPPAEPPKRKPGERRKVTPSKLTWAEVFWLERELPAMLTVDDMVERLHFKSSVLYKLDETGELESIVIDGQRVWPLPRVIGYLVQVNGLVQFLLAVGLLGLVLCRTGIICPVSVARGAVEGVGDAAHWIVGDRPYLGSCRAHPRQYVLPSTPRPARVAARARGRPPRGRGGRARFRRAAELVSAPLPRRFMLARVSPRSPASRRGGDAWPARPPPAALAV